MSRIYFRDATVESDSTATTAGVVKLSFSSEIPVLRKDKRGKFWEVLSHAPGDVNLGLLNRNGVVFQDHDDTNEIGEVVKDSAKVDADKRTRALIKLHDGEWVTRATQAPASIPVSVGYLRLSVVKTILAGIDGIETRVFAWKPYEISLLTGEPADPSVGINRSKNKRSSKRKCAECEGSGRCRCRSKEEDDADDDCEDCKGDGDCADCGGDGYFTSARSKIDSFKFTDAKQIVEQLTPDQKTSMRLLLDPTPAAGGGTATIDEPKVRADERTKVEISERSRIKEITTIADALIKDHGTKNDGKLADEVRKAATNALNSGESVEKFQVRILTDVQKATPAKPILLEDCTDEAGLRDYSWFRGVQSVVRQADSGRDGCRLPDGLEGEVHQEFIKRSKANGLGFPAAGFQVPLSKRVLPGRLTRADWQAMKRAGRDMQATVFPAGGAAVPTLLMPPIIELLRNRMILELCGKKTLGGLTGNVVIPRQDAPATAYSVSEIQALAASQQILGQISLNPKRVGATEAYSKQLVMQSSPDIEAFIRDDLFKVIALLWDYYGLAGSGVNNQPLGIFNTPGIGSVTFGATPTYKQIVSFMTAIRAANVNGPLAYISTPTTKGSLQTVAVTLTGATTVVGGSSNAIWVPEGLDGTMVGTPAYASNQVPNNQVCCGEFDQLIHAMWGGLDVVVDPYTKAANGEIVITINTWGDYTLRHPQAFVVSSDSGAQ